MAYKVTVKQDKGYEERSKKSTENDEEIIDEGKALDIMLEIMSLERNFLKQRNESLEKNELFPASNIVTYYID